MPAPDGTSACGGGAPGRGCGRRIVWGVTEDGKRIPLDPSAPVYVIVGKWSDGSFVVRRAIAYRADHAGDNGGAHLVSHFCTCPAVRQFTKGGSK